MIHYITDDQFDKLWPSHIQNPLFDTYKGRQEYWDTILTPKFNLKYSESPHREDPTFFGAIEGSPNNITLFLLQL